MTTNGEPAAGTPKALAALVLALVLQGGVASGGNIELVEENIRELKDLNREAVLLIPDLPPHAEVRLEAWVTGNAEEHCIELLEYEIKEPAAGEAGASPRPAPQLREVSAPVREEPISYPRRNLLFPESDRGEKR